MRIAPLQAAIAGREAIVGLGAADLVADAADVAVAADAEEADRGDRDDS